jgi:peptidylprolyl isomerase
MSTMASNLNSKRMLNVLIATLVLLAAIALYFRTVLGPGRAQQDSVEPVSVADPAPELQRALDEVDEQGLSRAVAVIQTTRGRIRFRFYSKDAPRTVKRIATLIRQGFYSGLNFHRVVPGFVIQGGDPSGSGSGGSGVRLPAEFNSRKHIPGTVAMARAADPDSADSQFYISLGTHPQLDGQYTVFGQLIEGQEVATQIQPGDRMTAVTLSE